MVEVSGLEKFNRQLRKFFYNFSSFQRDFPEDYLSYLFPSRISRKFYKNKLKIADLMNLTSDQIDELNQKIIDRHKNIEFDGQNDGIYKKAIKLLGLKKFLEVYDNGSKQILELIENYQLISSSDRYKELQRYLLEMPTIEDGLKKSQSILYDDIINSRYRIDPSKYPDDFKAVYPQLFPSEKDVPESLIWSFNNRRLKYSDIALYAEKFSDININGFLSNDDYYDKHYQPIAETLKKLALEYPLYFKNINISNTLLVFLSDLEQKVSQNDSYNINKALEEYAINKLINEDRIFTSYLTEEQKKEANLPEWAQAMGYDLLAEIKTLEDLNRINEKTIILNSSQRSFIELFGADNLKKISAEIDLFSNDNMGLAVLIAPIYAHHYLHRGSMYSNNSLLNIAFEEAKNNPLIKTNYEVFSNTIADLLLKTKMTGYTIGDNQLSFNYDFITGEFRNRHPEIFVDKSAPEGLKKLFYTNKMTPKTFLENPEWLAFIKDKNLLGVFPKLLENTYESVFSNGESFFTTYVNKYGNAEFLKFIIPYGDNINYNVNHAISLNEPFSKEILEQRFREAVYRQIIGAKYLHENTMPTDFRVAFPDLFLSDDAPKELKTCFYSFHDTMPVLLKEDPDLIKFLVDKNLRLAFGDIFSEVNLYDSKSEKTDEKKHGDFLELYVSKYGNLEFLKLISKYGEHAKAIYNEAFDINASKEELEQQFRLAIYNKILKRDFNYNVDMPTDFKTAFPDLFLSDDAPEALKVKFYNRQLLSQNLKENPGWIDFIKDKNLIVSFKQEYTSNNFYNSASEKPDDKLIVDFIPFYISKYGNEEFLKLVVPCGRFADLYTRNGALDVSASKEELDRQFKINIFNLITENQSLYSDYFFELLMSYNNFAQKIDYKKINPNLPQEMLNKNLMDVVCDFIKNDGLSYSPEKLPADFKTTFPDLFLPEGAPADFKTAFYSRKLTFHDTKKTENRIYIENRDLKQLLTVNGIYKEYFQLFGDKSAFKCLDQSSPTINHMINAEKINLMSDWFKRSGERFIPHHVVMSDFPIEQADKFFASGKKWSQLMKLKKYNELDEYKAALLKASMTFGVFDNDDEGFNKIVNLFSGLPQNIVVDPNKIANLNNNQELFLKFYTPLSTYLENKKQTIINSLEKNTIRNTEYENEIKKLEEQGESDLEGNITKVKKLLEDGLLRNEAYRREIAQIEMQLAVPENIENNYVLTANTQTDKDQALELRSVLEEQELGLIMTPQKAHRIFGSFKMQYDPKFREFFLKNIDQILKSDDYIKYIANIQKRFDEILKMNSNKNLTLDLAVAYIVNHEFSGVDKGNEPLAELVGASGYSQADFEKLQKIYNYGRARTFSSIPRVEFQNNSYSCEILRLDDPLALLIGNLTNCCQELNGAAETSMIHSATSKNGRIFVIKDVEGNIVAQSWVWRNGDTICFDNIEIPDKAFTRAENRKLLADNVYGLYKEAAERLIKEDEIIYKDFLDSGKITLQQYNDFRLKKVTVGLGYNDIATTIKENSIKDEQIVVPLEKKNIIAIDDDSGLYINDSKEQYIISGGSKVAPFTGEALLINVDNVKITDDTNISKKEKMILASLNEDDSLMVSESPIEDVADESGINKSNLKSIIYPNFTIIFSDSTKIEINKIKILVPHFEDEKQNEIMRNQILIQLKLVIGKILDVGKDIDVSKLSVEELAIYNEALGISEEQIEKERGISNGK